jgi:hypothetical protein
VLVRVPQQLEVPSLGGVVAGPAVLWAAVLVRVPQHLEVPFRNSLLADVYVVTRTVRPPLEGSTRTKT